LLAPAHARGVQSTVSHLLAQGKTSGTDTMHGLLTCLEALSSIPGHQSCPTGQDGGRHPVAVYPHITMGKGRW
jgi:hypothetical protein